VKTPPAVRDRAARVGASLAHLALLVAPVPLFGVGPRLLELPVLTVLALALVLEMQDRRAAPEAFSSAEPGATRLASLTGVALLLVCWAGLVDFATGSAIPFLPGLLLGTSAGLLGAGLRRAAINALGSGFTSGFEPRAARRVETGAYSVLRHPSETGLLLWAVGVALVLHSGLALGLVLLVLLPLSSLRISHEERYLARCFDVADVPARRAALLGPSPRGDREPAGSHS